MKSTTIIKATIFALIATLSSSAAFAAPATKTPTYAPVASGSAPAVSDLNGAIDVSGGAAKGNVAGFLAGKVSAPFYHDYGVQFDGGLGTVGGYGVKTVGAHAFYRNPSKFLVGGTYSRGWYANEHYNRFGAEGEYYQGNLTYIARAGYQNGLRQAEFTNLDLNWYLNDNLVVTPGFRNIGGQAWGRLATEWQPHALASAPGLSLFASTGAGNHGYAFGMLGVRYYYGNDKNLMRRHREDDPAATAPDDAIDNFAKFHHQGVYTPPIT